MKATGLVSDAGPEAGWSISGAGLQGRDAMEQYLIFVVDSVTERRIGRLRGTYSLDEVREIEDLIYQDPEITSIPEPVRLCRVELCQRQQLVGMTPFSLTAEHGRPSIEKLFTRLRQLNFCRLAVADVSGDRVRWKFPLAPPCRAGCPSRLIRGPRTAPKYRGKEGDSMTTLDAENISWITDPSFMEDSVLRVLGRLPDTVREWVEQNVVFMCQEGGRGAALTIPIPRMLLEGRFKPPSGGAIPEDWICIRLVQFLAKLEEEPEDIKDCVAAHEIAHCWLGHVGTAPNEEAQRREDEANEQAASWGFQCPPDER